jgi:hypothetical protein
MLCIPRRQIKFNDIHGRKIEYLFNKQKNSWLKLVSFKKEMPIELDLERNGEKCPATISKSIQMK